MTTGWLLLLLVLFVSSQSVDSQSTTDDETNGDEGLLSELQKDIERLMDGQQQIQQHHRVMERLLNNQQRLLQQQQRILDNQQQRFQTVMDRLGNMLQNDTILYIG